MFSANCTLRADFADFAVSSHQINGHRAPSCRHVAPFYSSSSVQCPDLCVQTQQHTIIFAYELFRIHAKRLQACLPPCAFLFVFRARECAIIEVTYVSRWCACVPKHAKRVRNIMLTHVPRGRRSPAVCRGARERHNHSGAPHHDTLHCSYVAGKKKLKKKHAARGRKQHTLEKNIGVLYYTIRVPLGIEECGASVCIFWVRDSVRHICRFQSKRSTQIKNVSQSKLLIHIPRIYARYGCCSCCIGRCGHRSNRAMSINICA